MVPLVQTCSGKVLISRLKEDQRDELLANDPHFQSLSKAKRAEFEKMVTAVGSNGCLVTASELTEGVTDIAAPVGITGTDTAAVLAISCFVPRKQTVTNQLRDLVVKYAGQINRNLGVSAFKHK